MVPTIAFELKPGENPTGSAYTSDILETRNCCETYLDMNILDFTAVLEDFRLHGNVTVLF